jgi:3-hydroxyisobutyrate dehydrogenase-like beta-hydroxyacid dehydrogenase
MMRVGFIGLGDQGAPMAQAIAESGHPLTVWARRRETIDAVCSSFTFAVAESVASLGAMSDIVALCVYQDTDVEELLLDGKLLESMPAGSVIVNHGTGSPTAAGRFAELARKSQITMLDAPVSGGAERARSRTLSIMVGGDKEAFLQCQALFATYATVVTHLGPPGSGQFAKLINNVLVSSNMRNAQQALLLAEFLGFDVIELGELILASSGSSRALEQLVRTDTDLFDHFQTALGKDISEFATAVEDTAFPTADLVTAARLGVAGMSDMVRLRAERSRNRSSDQAT